MLEKENVQWGEILGVKDIQRILKIGLNKTYDLLRSGEIESFKIGREIKIPQYCLNQYIKRKIS